MCWGGRAFDLLQTLIENHDRVVSKDELYERVWPGLAVEPGNLQVQIWALRKVLGRQVIATVARRGYRFMPAVVRVSAGATRLAEANQAPMDSAPPPPAATDALLDKLVRGMADHRPRHAHRPRCRHQRPPGAGRCTVDGAPAWQVGCGRSRPKR